jgi:hypothetical protein
LENDFRRKKMRTKIWSIGLVVFIVLVCGSSLTLGEEKVAFTLDLSGGVGDVVISDSSQAQGYVLGWTFRLPGSSGIWITQVGVFDADGLGLGSEHEIGIWYYDDTEWVELLLPTVPAGVSTELFENYRYFRVIPAVPLTPNPDEAYNIGVLFPPGNQDDYLFRIWDTDPPGGPVVTFDGTDVDYWHSGNGLYSRDLSSDTLDRPSSGPYTDQRGLNVNFKFTTTPPPTPVDIDIKPGSYPNSINLGSNGVVPVAILSSEEFDATTVDPETVTLAGAGVAIRGKGNKYLSSEEDVDGDGLLDLSLKVETENLDEDLLDGYAILEGATYDGESIEGYDEITIVPPE